MAISFASATCRSLEITSSSQAFRFVLVLASGENGNIRGGATAVRHHEYDASCMYARCMTASWFGIL
ncbi:hypothetical protein B0H12DRAFT_1093925 [Mycena haematopus]|nr:hypothetical protein B0H12DRAFT_1093925 [Mycena haematopus]